MTTYAPWAMDRATLDHAIATSPEHMKLIWRAVAEFGITLDVIDKENFESDAYLGPFVAINIVKNQTKCSQGPCDYNQKMLSRLLLRVECIAISVGEPQLKPYAMAIWSALNGHNALIVESHPEHEAAWCRLLRAQLPNLKFLLGQSLSDGEG